MSEKYDLMKGDYNYFVHFFEDSPKNVKNKIKGMIKKEVYTFTPEEWDSISHMHLSEAFIDAFAPFLNWKTLVMTNNLSEKALVKHQKYIDFNETDALFYESPLDKKTINKLKTKLNWWKLAFTSITRFWTIADMRKFRKFIDWEAIMDVMMEDKLEQFRTKTFLNTFAEELGPQNIELLEQRGDIRDE